MPEEVRFLWGSPDKEGHPTAWIRPPEAGTWYWVADGILSKGAEETPYLAIFLWKIRPAKGEGIFAFALAGGAIAVISNPHEDWTRWKIEQHFLPHAIPDPSDDTNPDSTAQSNAHASARSIGAQRFFLSSRRIRNGSTFTAIAAEKAAMSFSWHASPPID